MGSLRHPARPTKSSPKDWIGTSWSPQADFEVQPHPPIDGSLLALGARNGSILLMRYATSQFSIVTSRLHTDSKNFHFAYSQLIVLQLHQLTAFLMRNLADTMAAGVCFAT